MNNMSITLYGVFFKSRHFIKTMTLTSDKKKEQTFLAPLMMLNFIMRFKRHYINELDGRNILIKMDEN